MEMMDALYKYWQDPSYIVLESDSKWVDVFQPLASSLVIRLI